MSPDSIYVMWSSAAQLSKIGLAFAPHARASQLRREKSDDTIRLMTCWNIITSGDFGGALNLEMHIHEALRAAHLDDKSNPFASEWFSLPWPAATEFVEQWAQLWAPCGLRLQRMPGAHGK